MAALSEVMKYFAICYFVLSVLCAQHLEAKLAFDRAPKSSELLGNSIQGNNNDNEIVDLPLHIDKQIEDEKEDGDDADEAERNEDAVEVEIPLPRELEVSLNDVDGGELGSRGEIKSSNDDLKQQKATAEQQLVAPQNEKFTKTTKTTTTKSIKSGEMVSNKITKTSSTPSPIGPGNVKRTKTTKLQQRPYSFVVNPLGQLSALLGGDQLQYLQDYNFLFNAERHTVFQLHTCQTTAATTAHSTGIGTSTMSSGRVLNVVSGSLGAAFGVNPTMPGAGAPPTKVEEVQLYNAASLRQSRYNPFNPTRILIHGWFGGSHAGVYNTLVPAYLKLDNGSFNVFTVDWGRGAIADYITASYRVKPVGKVVAKFIDFLHREAGMRFEDLHVIGFSMGAHIAGISGKYVQTGRLPIIYALDPALPLFRYDAIDERIALTDADYVEVIHTSVGTYGYDRPVGHVDFYVNYGSGQPGCFFNECSHFRAFQILAESLQSPKAFRGQGCDVKLWLDLIKSRRCLMGTGRNLTLGGDPRDAITLRKRGGGVYYFVTNASPPYGRG